MTSDDVMRRVAAERGIDRTKVISAIRATANPGSDYTTIYNVAMGIGCYSDIFEPILRDLVDEGVVIRGGIDRWGNANPYMLQLAKP